MNNTPAAVLVEKDARDAIARADTAITETTPLLEEAERRQTERRGQGRPRGGRRAIDRPINAWSTGQLAVWIGMSSGFVLTEITCGEIKASMFGGNYRIATAEVRRYLDAKGFPLPGWMIAA